jgi:hypothetical protein
MLFVFGGYNAQKKSKERKETKSQISSLKYGLSPNLLMGKRNKRKMFVCAGRSS